MQRRTIQPLERARRRRPQAARSPHVKALLRALAFAAAAISLIVPLAIATRHAGAEFALTRSWPLDLTAVRPENVLLPLLPAAEFEP